MEEIMTRAERKARQQKVLKLRETGRKTFREIGEILGGPKQPLTRERARQIYVQAKEDESPN